MKRKTLKLFLLCFLFFSTISIASSVPLTFMWDANTDNITVGYKLFMRTSGQAGYNYANPIAVINGREVTTADYTTPDVPDGEIETFYFVLRAFSASGRESGDSAEVSQTVDNRYPPNPKGFSCIKK